VPNSLTTKGISQTDIIHDAQLIKAVPINDTDKGDEKVLAYNEAAAKIAYIPRCPEILIHAIQHLIITIPAPDLTAQVLINEVDMDNTFLVYGGIQCSSSLCRAALARIELTDSTHILATRYLTGVSLIINICIIQCTAGIKSIQRGTIQIGAETYHDATIDEVDTDKTFVSYLSVTSATDTLTRALLRVFLLNSTTIRAQRDSIYSEMEISYEVVEFI